MNVGWGAGRGSFRAAPRVLLLSLMLAVLGAGAGFVYGELQGRVHSATAVILLNPTEGNPFAPDSAAGVDLVDLETEAQLVLSDEVANLVADRRDGDTAANELVGVKAEVPPNTQLIEITVEDKSRDEALDRAQAFAEVYLEYRQSRSETAGLRQGRCGQGADPDSVRRAPGPGEGAGRGPRGLVEGALAAAADHRADRPPRPAAVGGRGSRCRSGRPRPGRDSGVRQGRGVLGTAPARGDARRASSAEDWDLPWDSAESGSPAGSGTPTTSTHSTYRC